MCPQYMRVTFYNDYFIVEAFLKVSKDMYDIIADDANNCDGVLRGYYRSRHVRIQQSRKSTYLTWADSFRYDMTTPDAIIKRVKDVYYPTMRAYYKQMQIQKLSQEITNITKSINYD